MRVGNGHSREGNFWKASFVLTRKHMYVYPQPFWHSVIDGPAGHLYSVPAGHIQVIHQRF